MRDSTVLSQWRVTSGLPVIQEPRADLRLGSVVGSHEFARPTTPCSNPLAFHRNLTTMHGGPLCRQTVDNLTCSKTVVSGTPRLPIVPHVRNWRPPVLVT